MRLDASLPPLERVLLTSIVRQTLGSESVEVGTWNITLLQGGIGEASSGLYRVAGVAQTARGLQPWSLVLKVVPVPAAGATFGTLPVEGWNREILTYQSGLLDDLPAGLAAPRCYAITEHADFVWLWLEDIRDEAGPRWPLAQFARAARHLGRLNGTYLAARPLPAYPWLQRHLLRWRAARNAAFWATFDQVRAEPEVQEWWPGDLGGRAQRLWEQRHDVLDRLDRLPQTLVHGDADRRNLLTRHGRHGDETVAVDWAFTGVAAVGEELVNLIVASTLWFQVDLSDLPELADHCLDGYRAGLADVGWRGERRLVVVGFVLAAALRYGPLFGPPFGASGLEWWAGVTGQSVEDCLTCWATVRRFAFDRLDEAREIVEAV
jgi:hypothetical protein